jgi:hypothetical protein
MNEVFWRTLRNKERIVEIEQLSTVMHSVENSLWKRLRTCRKTDYSMNEVFWRTLRNKERILETERLSTVTHSVENSLWKRLQTCRKTDYSMNESLLSRGGHGSGKGLAHHEVSHAVG